MREGVYRHGYLIAQVKLRCSALEDQLINLVVIAMQRSEDEDSPPPVGGPPSSAPPLPPVVGGSPGGAGIKSEEGVVGVLESGSNQLWQHLSSQLIFFVLFQFASFPHMVLALYDKVGNARLNHN